MRKLALSQMEDLQGGSWWGCAAAIAGGALFVASLFVVPGEAVAVAFYAVNAAASPTIVGLGVADSC